MRKLTLEERIIRLEKLLSNRRSANNSKQFRKCESSHDAARADDATCNDLVTLLSKKLPDQVVDGYAVPNTGTLAIDIQDDMGDEEYYDEWESNYMHYDVKVGYYIADLGIFASLDEAAEAISKHYLDV